MDAPPVSPPLPFSPFKLRNWRRLLLPVVFTDLFSSCSLLGFPNRRQLRHSCRTVFPLSDPQLSALVVSSLRMCLAFFPHPLAWRIDIFHVSRFFFPYRSKALSPYPSFAPNHRTRSLPSEQNPLQRGRRSMAGGGSHAVSSFVLPSS